MSLQVQSSQQQAPSGRRTPQIYQNLATSGNAPAPTSANTSSSAKGSSKLSLKAPSGKQSPVVDLTNSEPALVAPKDSPKTQNLAVAVTKLDKTQGSPKVAEKETDEKAATTNGSTTNGSHSEKETNGKHKESVVEPVKSKPETPKREEEKKTKETPKKEEDKEKKVKESPRASPRSTPQKQQQTESIPVEQIKTPESADKKTKESPAPTTPEQKKKPAAVENAKAEGDEMESLVVEPSEYEDSPMPPRTGGKTKLLKYSGAPPTRARISPFRVNEATNAATTNASTIVNLSTVSEGQGSATGSAEPSPSIDFNRPLRAISGRRGTRPITDIQFTYRKSSELNDSVSSLNVTVGSEIHNDSLRTPAPGSSRKRKAMTPESTSDALDVKETFDSPKRGRLDLSGFLGMVASPVTMLKNRLSRVRLHASTPVAKRSLDEDDLTTCVQAEATTTTANISGEGAKMDVDPAADEEAKKVEGVEKIEGAETETTLKEGQTEVPEGTTATEESKTEDGSGDGADQVEVKDVTNKPRQFCVVM